MKALSGCAPLGIFFLNHSFPLLLKEACSTNKLAKKNNLSEKSTQKNSSMLPCQRNLAIMRNQLHSPRLGKDAASPTSAASFLCDLTLATFSFGQIRKHGRSSYVSWKQRSSVFMTHIKEPSRQNTFFGIYNSKSYWTIAENKVSHSKLSQGN